MMQFNQYRFTLTFVNEVLGSVPASPEIYEKYIRKKAEEAGIDVGDIHKPQTLPEIEEDNLTVFRYLDEALTRPYIPSYIIKGYMKEACSGLRRGNTLSKKLRAYKKVIDLNVTIRPLEIEFIMPPGSMMGRKPRPLRAETAQGPRVTLVDSETVPAGTKIEFTVSFLDGCEITEKLLHEWFLYGQRHGIGQWRNADYGIFTYEMERLPAEKLEALA